ncbi:3-deoxy-8-phosphooctulonate synthase [Halodesulfurarchaeum formicicum]|uniref:3-deoxy-8-phosphooctulonate synthase n=1 Tax=Halodesulfurarchaeum formicicum TaxID=1873524 RepID=A0A1J1ACL9_9EURY|nr:3-deoxy-8-phosphooctulonate synthase [Halodesulfurarchaeum formicicum]APE95329.1 2-dehydro-3-deoxyphosphooctonate aldolase (KDO 8-P synthase) [Halodesulfurarchaeum formicicum]
MELSNNISVSNEDDFFLIAGPCAIESEEQVLKTARELKDITDRHDIDLIFKSSFDKANRSSISSYRGPGMERGLEILQRVKDEYDLPVITDFHVPEQAEPAADVVDALQVPAFLSRQTDMLTAAGETGLPINVKKGQFLAADGMDNVVNKIESTGNERVMLCERGAMFGYNNLVADMRNLDIMKGLDKPVVFDTTHSVQRPGAQGDSSGGDRRFAPTLARAALGVGVAGIFAEVHPDPSSAKSDAATQLPLDDFESLLKQWKAIDKAVKHGK